MEQERAIRLLELFNKRARLRSEYNQNMIDINRLNIASVELLEDIEKIDKMISLG